jgi:hypothetical protein
MVVPSLLAVALLASAATARATGDLAAFGDAGHDRHVHRRARALAQTCPSGSAYDATLAACAVSCDGGYVRDDTANTTIDASTVFGRCEPCAPGSARESGTANACVACPVGTSNSRSGQIACVPCSYQGGTKYADVTGAVTCQECPAGTAQRAGDETDAQGATLLSGLSLDQCGCGLRGGHASPHQQGSVLRVPRAVRRFLPAVPQDDKQPVAVLGRKQMHGGL